MSLRKALPSPVALFMFEAAARHLSFTRAGSEFNVTQSAISRMIKRLELHLGTILFDRNPSGLKLTADGQELFKSVSMGFKMIEAGLDELQSRQDDTNCVTISISSAFAMHWFVPRMDRFQLRFPEINLRLQLVKGEPVGPFEDVDLAVRFNQPPNSEQHSWKLADEVIIPVCSEAYLADHGSVEARRSGHILAKQSEATRLPWEFFIQNSGFPMPQGERYLIFSDYALVIQAALKGRALALGWLHVIGEEFLERGLVRAGHSELKSGFSYHIVATKNRPLRDASIVVKDWIVAEMDEMLQKIGAL